MKAVMLSIRPQWCELICNGKKTVEVRKSRPKLETPFKCYIYQTKPKDRLLSIMRDGDENYGDIYHGKPVFIKTYGEGYWSGRNQKVIGEFVCDNITEFRSPAEWAMKPWDYSFACLKQKDIEDYAGGKTLYGWHISSLQIYDKPRELSEFTRFGFFGMGNSKVVCGNRGCEHFIESADYDEPPECNIGDCILTRAFQSWGYVNGKTD